MTHHERTTLELQLAEAINAMAMELAYRAHVAAVSILETHGATLRGASEGPRRNR